MNDEIERTPRDEADAAPQGVPPTRPRVRLVIESDAADVSEMVLLSVVSDAIRAVNGRINVTSAELLVDGVAVEVPR